MDDRRVTTTNPELMEKIVELSVIEEELTNLSNLIRMYPEENDYIQRHSDRYDQLISLRQEITDLQNGTR